MTSERHDRQNNRLHALLRAAQETGAFDRNERLTPPCEALAQELYNSALPPLLAILKDGRIATAGPVASGVILDPEDLDYLTRNKDTREDLALEMISRALRPFLASVVDRDTWTSSQSSLTTFFLNRCLMTKGVVLREWVKHRRNRQDERAGRSQGIEWSDRQSFDQEHELLRHVVFQLIQEAPRDVRPILEIVSRGFDVRDAARVMEISENAARTRLYRWRKHVVTPRLDRYGEKVLPRGYALVDYLLTDRHSAA